MGTQVTEREYKTDDMGLVTWLRMQGHEPKSVSYQDDYCSWLFDRSDALVNDVIDFQEDSARVSPKQFSKNFRITRGEFYDARDEHRGR